VKPSDEWGGLGIRSPEDSSNSRMHVARKLLTGAF